MSLFDKALEKLHASKAERTELEKKMS